jgi:hypothetical protein
MAAYITISSALYRRMLEHLFSGLTEQLAFFLATNAESDRETLRVSDLYCVPSRAFSAQTAYHINLGDEVRAQMIKWAWDNQSSLIEVHSHLGNGEAAFSPTDLVGLEEFVPHVWWRLQGRPYAALVFSPRNFDALVWMKSPNVTLGLTALRIAGLRDDHPTSLTIRSIGQPHGTRHNAI